MTTQDAKAHAAETAKIIVDLCVNLEKLQKENVELRKQIEQQAAEKNGAQIADADKMTEAQ